MLTITEFKNPVLPGEFADPDLVCFDGKLYIYPTTDGFEGWSGTQFQAFSLEEDGRFQSHGVILDVASDQVSWATGHAWAPCMLRKNGVYYFFFCAKDATGESCIGLATAKSPLGPFAARPQPLVTMPMMREHGIRMWQTIDPSVYVEGEDMWLLFGNGAPAIAKLSPDLTGLVPGTLRNIDGAEDFREAIAVMKRGGFYHFTWSCDDTGSENYHVNYGVADNLYGPIHYQYPILEKDVARGILGTGHHSIVRMQGTEEHSSDRYFIAYHRFATPIGKYTEGKGWHREVCISPLAFGDDGLMQKVR
ncbi:MAG: family 43 glycosylhydrolase [Lachnospiraceae bacterium]|nr:family 43 glycosylhydrolase [Lachnospiraceae bacterium]